MLRVLQEKVKYKAGNTVCHIRWDSQGAFLMQAHADESLVPAFDNLAHADCKGPEPIKRK